MSSHSKPHMTPQTRLLKCFVLISLCCKTKHLRSLVRAIVKGFEWVELLRFSSITLSYVQAVQSSFFCFRHQICHNALLTLHFSSFAGNDITDRKVSQSLLQNQNSPSITVHGRFMVSRNTTKNIGNNVLFTLNQTTHLWHKPSLWLYYRFFWQILTS